MTMRWFERAGALLRKPAGLTGAFVGLVLFGLEGEWGARLAGAVLGWIYGVVVGRLIRWFGVIPGMYPLVGLLSGPVPFLLLPFGMTKEERGGVWFATALLGFLVGCVEWAHRRHSAACEAGRAASGPVERPPAGD